MKMRKNNTQSSARLTQNVNIVSKNVQILQASIASTYIVFCEMFTVDKYKKM